MANRIREIVRAIRDTFSSTASRLRGLSASTVSNGTHRALSGLSGSKRTLVVIAVVGATGYFIYKHPPLQHVNRGEIGIRVNQLTGTVSEFRDGGVIAVPGVHEMRVYSLRDQTYKPKDAARVDGVQSNEGLSLGVDIAFRFALDPTKVAVISKNLPDDVGKDVVEPAVNGVMYKTFAKYTVREIFATKRAEIQQAIETELKAKLAADGVVLKSVQIGKVELPADYKRGMEQLLAEELASEKMKYTLELKDKRVREQQLEGEAEKVRRQKAAEAAAQEQIIAARAQEEAMKHVLPLRERQIRQRELETQANNVARIKGAEGNAVARKIEANGEAEARQRLAEAEAYRLERVGKANAEQMGREGTLISKYPLLIQKTLADKLSDKVQVIIASPPAAGGFIGANLIGTPKDGTAVANEESSEERVATKKGE